MLYLFVLGRDSELSKFEIESVLETKGIKFRITDENSKVIVVDCDELDPKIINDLGGVIKIAKVISNSSRIDQIEDSLSKVEMYTGTKNKIEYYIDSFSSNLLSFVEDYLKDYFKGISLKALYKKNSEPSKLINKDILETGVNIVVFKNYIGKAVAITNPLELKKRDLARPEVDYMKVISLRLAKILINISKAKVNQTLLDPFCVAPESNIFTDNNNFIKIKNIKIGDSIYSYDNNLKDLKNNIVTKTFVSDLTKRKLNLFKIKTYGGKELLATENHPFYTPSGWTRLDNLNINSKVAIALSREEVNYIKKTGILLDKKSLIKNIPNERNKTISLLKKLKLLPLKYEDTRLPILAGFLGHIFSDGILVESNRIRKRKCILKDGSKKIYKINSYDYSVVFIVGTLKDVDNVKNDIQKIGLNNKIRVKERTNKVKFGNRSVVIHSYAVTISSKPLAILLKSLGGVIGKKTLKEFSIPSWIFKSSKLVSREFLAGINGGDGSKVCFRLKKRKIYSPLECLNNPYIMFTKSKKLSKNCNHYSKQLAELFAEFEIKTKIKHYYENGSISTRLYFDTNFNNIIKLCNIIGYKYSNTKNNISLLTGQYLKMRIKYPSNRNSWPIKMGNIPKFSEWLKNNEANIKAGLIWDTVESIKKIDRNINVMNIEVKKTHNYIANGFLTHNCGSGTVLQESLLKGINVIGIDSDLESIKQAEKNTSWLVKEYKLKNKFQIINYDCRKLCDKVKDDTVDAVVSEPYMGPYIRKLPNIDEAKELVLELSNLYDELFSNLRNVVKKNGRVVIIIPKIRTRENKVIFIDFKAISEKNGFNLANKPIDYGYQENKILREIYVLEKA